MPIRKLNKAIFVIIALGIATTILRYLKYQGPAVIFIRHTLDVLISLLFVSMFFTKFLKSPSKVEFLKKNIAATALVAAFLAILVIAKYHHFFVAPHRWHKFPAELAFLICVFM